MFSQRKRFFALTALVLISLVIGISQVFADGPSSSEPEPAVPNDNVRSSELDPEVRALQNEVQVTDASVDSEGNPTDAEPSTAFVEPVEEKPAPEDAQATTFTYFKRYPGVAFQPRDSDTGYDYFGNGCISPKGSDYFVLDLQLPAGAEIDFVRLYYYDTSTANSRLYLTWYDGQGGYTDVDYVDSAGTSGYGTAGVFTSYLVDPINQAITLVWRQNTTGSSMALCGARIRYQVTIGTAFLPVITRGGVSE